MSAQNRLWSWIIILVLTLIWGSSFIMLKRALDVYSPEQVFAGRMMVAALILAPWSIPLLRRLRKKYWVPMIIFALISNLITTILYATAQTRIDSAVNGMINTLTPLMTLLVGVVFYRQKMSSFQGIGLFLGLIGTIILVIQAQGGEVGMINWFAIIAVAATFCNGFTGNILKFSLAGLTALEIASLSFLIVLPIALVEAFRTDMFSLMMTGDPGWASTRYLIILGLFSNALGLFLIGKLIQLSSPVFASLTTYLVPLLALFWGFMDSENITLFQILAMTLILISVFVVDRFDKTPQPETH